MRWEFMLFQYETKYCSGRGLRVESIKTYNHTLGLFANYMHVTKRHKGPEFVTAGDIFDFLDHLKNDRGNGQNTINKSAGIIRKFYEGLVDLGHLDHRENPARNVKRIRRGMRKIRDVLSIEESKRLINQPKEDSFLGVRDKAILLLLYSTGIRASECAGLKEKDVDLDGGIIRVHGKGGDERAVPLCEETIKYLEKYKATRGYRSPLSPFFNTRNGTGITRKGIWDRVKKWIRKSKIKKKISPHNLRHTFATHALKRGTNLVTLQELLGHRNIMSTMNYLKITVDDLRKAISAHPVNGFSDILEKYIPNVRLPFQIPRSGFS